MELGLAFLAGLVSIFSPCVLPLLPLVFGTAVSEHRLGPLALVAGLALSFLVIGLFVATIGFSLGLDDTLFRMVAAVLLLLAGVVLVVPAFHARLSLATAPFGNWVEQHYGGGEKKGVAGQFGVGVLLGAIWTPCVGPTLGAVSVLAAQGRDLGQVALTMLIFAIGTALPFAHTWVCVARDTDAMAWADIGNQRTGKLVLGLVLILTGAFILTGYDKQIQTGLLNLSPEWLSELTTRF